MHVKTRPCDCEARIAWRGGASRIFMHLCDTRGFVMLLTTALECQLKRPS